MIDGAKTWITNGVEGDFVVVACRTDRDAGAGGLSLIVVEADAHGFSRSKLRKMGWHSSDTGELTFENVRVPLGNLVGGENEGFYLIMETFVLERLVTAATSVGSARLALEETRKYVLERHAFGKPIGKFQAIRHRLADLYAELEAAAQLVYHTAWLHEKGENPVAEACMAKLLATELSKKTADECLQFFGGFGTVEEYPIERFFRDSRFGTIVAGTSEIMREVIAKTAIDGFVFPKRESDEDDAPVPPPPAVPADPVPPPVEEPLSAGDGYPVLDGAGNPFARDAGTPDVFEADVTDTLEAIFTETRPVTPRSFGVDETPQSEPLSGEEHEIAPALDAREPEPAPEPEAPSVEPGESVALPSEVTEPAYFPPAGARPIPMAGREAVILAGGPPSLAVRIPVPTSVAELFETLPLRFRAERAAGWNARFHFRFKDVERSDWTVVIEDGSCRAFAGHEGAADCVVTTTEKTYLAIEGGLQAPETAFLLGKVKVSNIVAMTKFGKLFRKVAP